MKSGKEAESEKALETEARERIVQKYKHDKEREDTLLFGEKAEHNIC
jgi:hypothetical protein